MPSIFTKIQQRIEIYRLEQRYTRNRNRRSTFISNAVYVDGEYVYQTPNNTGSSYNTYSTSTSKASSPIDGPSSRSRRSLEESASRNMDAMGEEPTPAQKKRLNRFSSMPGFGSLSKSSGRDWRTSGVDVREVR